MRKFIMYGVIIAALLIFNIAVYTTISGKTANDFTVTEVKGDVEVKLPGKTNWQKATKGMVVPEGSDISSGFNSSMKMKSENSHMEIKPLTQINVATNKIENGVYQTNVKLKLGKVQAKIDKLEGTTNQFKVETPTAVAGVRGTEEEVEFSEDLGTEIELLEGEASLEDEFGEETYVAEDQEAVVNEEGDVEDALDMAKEEATVDIAPDGMSEEEQEFFDDVATDPITDVPTEDPIEDLIEEIDEDVSSDFDPFSGY